jgi:hypothetical protein
MKTYFKVSCVGAVSLALVMVALNLGAIWLAGMFWGIAGQSANEFWRQKHGHSGFLIRSARFVGGPLSLFYVAWYAQYYFEDYVTPRPATDR